MRFLHWFSVAVEVGIELRIDIIAKERYYSINESGSYNPY